MKRSVLKTVCLLLAAFAVCRAQEVIPLYTGEVPGAKELYPEKEFFSNVWRTQVVSNVSRPTLTVYKPGGTPTGSGIVVCPGGGFMALSINSEGIDVAKWLAARGMTAFVLKYRLAHTGDDATQEFGALFQDRPKFEETVGKVIPLAIEDGLAAMTYVRKHARDWGLQPDRIGIIGFSAGGTVAAASAFRYSADNRPAFVAPIYAAAGRMKGLHVPADAPPAFIAAATDDNLGLAPDSVALYQQWTEAKLPAELHMYLKGGHGFGMRKQGTPSDNWIDQFGEWLAFQGWLNK